jgi:catechol 2,3-dioxygenase-like lactoylglutathione lyase family enzyme
MLPGSDTPEDRPDPLRIVSISAVTLATHDMARAVQFYRTLGFTLCYGGPDADFTTLKAGTSYLNLIAQPEAHSWSWWGRVIFRVTDVDDFHARAVATGLHPASAPADAPWGERFFHLTDPDGHELSFAQPLDRA